MTIEEKPQKADLRKAEDDARRMRRELCSLRWCGDYPSMIWGTNYPICQYHYNQLKGADSKAREEEKKRLAELRRRIVLKEDELSKDEQMPQGDFHATSRAFMWVCQQMDELTASKQDSEGTG